MDKKNEKGLPDVRRSARPCPGEKIKLLSLHRNVFDETAVETAVEEINKEGKTYLPTTKI